MRIGEPEIYCDGNVENCPHKFVIEGRCNFRGAVSHVCMCPAATQLKFKIHEAIVKCLQQNNGLSP